MKYDIPRLIDFGKIGDSSIGYLSVAQSNQNLPFEIKRTFWSYYTPDSVLRGRHAHHATEMILIAVAGRIIVNTEMPNRQVDVFTLDQPHIGLYMPAYCWHTMQYSHSSVQLVLASSLYDESDYIRDYAVFKSLS